MAMDMADVFARIRTSSKRTRGYWVVNGSAVLQCQKYAIDGEQACL